MDRAKMERSGVKTVCISAAAEPTTTYADREKNVPPLRRYGVKMYVGKERERERALISVHIIRTRTA